ncbi:ABC transporter substrate-binding protein [Plantactinospora soyae]|uniref:Raffinose/stachyose/melibiose transport system substrate-binding protein n=1 Tax=Plantactinospora soyae TaxID=1544732 RepID=A0A927MCR7_9ACTN|nr:extracellular solute-binding protein [Plantactinospora soyae]MBE1488695.1 raffinose/stachyose/melibiose transport system substrate-binding protein [Plantactinospora soyae]
MMGPTTRRRKLLVGVLALATAISAGCGRGGDGAEESGGAETLTWWHNANAEPGLGFWKTVADEYHAKNPNVTVEVVPMQNEQFQTRIPVALQSQEPPDVFQSWGGGQLADQVSSGRIKDISEAIEPWIGELGPAAQGWQVDGKQYAVPYSLGVVGFWYNKDLFSQAGISAPPATWEELLGAIGKLKAANLTPITIGGKDRWPDAFYWGYLAVRGCSQQVLKDSVTNYKFDDPCWIQAGQKTRELIDAKPFQKGFLATSAQQGATSSAGLLANGKAAMELQGHWNPGVMRGLTPDRKGLGDKLGWFPFPAVSGGAGDPKAALGGGDGFACSYKAPDSCADFLKYIASVDVQKRWAALNTGLPVTKGSESAVTDPTLKSLLDFRAGASHVQLYFDIAVLTSVGQALNEAIANQFAGKATPEQVIEALNTAAKNR